ncbi:MAG: hypothetical protein QOF71_523, partial [Candidatus Eremiobacteraeota bacterium]|nr:hypothetical protein [Candidatus Eremiobacteraeota bacterium]
ALRAGDRVRIDRITPFERKPGLAGGRTYTYDNRDRWLPIERGGRERVMHLVAKQESTQARFTDILKIVLCGLATALGAMLFLVRPSIATAAFFVFSLAAVEAPATWLDLIIPMPWRPVPEWIGDTIHGFVRPALLLFAFCLIDGDADVARERVFAWFVVPLGAALGTVNAYAQWSLNYAARPAEHLDRIFYGVTYSLSTLIVVALVVAFVRAGGNDRHRISWIAAAFLFAGAANLASVTLYPGHIQFWINNLLVSAAVVPIVTVWIAVVRHQFFNVDFVVNRAVVYASLTAAVIGTLWIAEEIGTYVFYSSSDLAYAVFYGISMAIALCTGKIKAVLDHVVDRFIFRDRREQRQALEFIAGYILDAETVEDVYRALLQDAAHALKLSFGGILARQPDGGYILAQSYDWPEDFTLKLGPNDELTQAVTRTRGALTFSGKDTRLIQRSFPNERLTFVAPLFFDRTVSGIVVYGHNVSGLDLDPDEREHLVRVVAHASIALNTIELNRYRNAAPNAAPEPLPLPAT